MTLHCISVDPSGDLADALDQSIESNDAVLLLDRAADLALSRQAVLNSWANRGVQVYALANTDRPAAGNIQQICYAEWVALSVKHASQRLWR